MSTNEGFNAGAKLDQLSADPNVRVPEHVKASAAAAEALHQQLYAQPDPAAAQPAANEPGADQRTPEQIEAERAAQAANAAQQIEQPQHPAPSAADQNVTAEEWRHRFLSMQGRYNAAVRDKGAMEEQMTQLGQELVRTQNILASIQSQPANQQAASHAHESLITDADRENYGDELIDLARRAGREAIAPELEHLRAENQRLTQRVQSTSKRELFATLDQHLPTWRQINTNQHFKMWLRLPNVYTGQLRGNMLKAAVDGAEAPKIIALFQDFLREAAATGQDVPAAQHQQQEPQPAPRTAALDLETLAAPGRARPASGDSQVPSEKPIYSRADIAKFFDEKRRGLWAHRQQAAQDYENDLSAAQREGRIR